ncbi:MAG: hypothetical protein QOF08_472 [Gaiellales bacterium]|jgi:hypothetical protein|nr:hypothetical protein [Gaiellales bacterium]
MSIYRRPLPLAALFALLLATASAQATATTIPIAHVHSVVVDSAHSQEFVSGTRDATDQTALFVMNADGTPKQAILDEAGAAGMVLDGSSLYVARCSAGASSTEGVIDVIDTATLTRTESIPIALTPNAGVGPCNLAIAGGRLWYSPGDQWQHLAAVDLAAPHTQHTYNVGPVIYGEQFVTSPTDPNLLIIADQDLSGTEVYKFDVSAATPVLSTTLSMFDEGSVSGMAITPDGATFLASADTAVWRYDVATMTKQGSLTTNGSANGVAISPDGAYVAAAVNNVVRFYHADTGALIGSHSMLPQTIQFGRIAFSGNGMRLYVPTWTSYYFAPTTLRVVPNPILPTPALTLKPSASLVAYGGHVTLTVHLGGSHSNRSVRIYRTPYGGTRALLKTVTVGAGGNFAFTSPALARRTTFQAEYDGDASSNSAISPNVGVKVRALLSITPSGFYAVSGGYHLYHYHAGCWGGSAPCPTFLGRIRPAHGGVGMMFVMQRHTSSGWVISVKGSVTTNSSGYAKAIYRYTGTGFIGLPMRTHVVWGGDADHVGGTSPWTYLRITT